MNIGRLHSKTRHCNILRVYLHAIGTGILFLFFSSFTTLAAITAEIQETGLHGQEKLQSSSHGASENNHPVLAGLEVEEVEESKEEKKDGPTALFTFSSPRYIAANEYEFLEDDILVENNSNHRPQPLLYLLFHNLRIPSV